MAISLYDVSIPVYLNMMRNLAAILGKAEAHAKEKGADVAAYLEARLTADMLPLSRQIQMVSDSAKGATARLAQLTPPAMPDTETTFAELKERLAKTIAFVETIKREQVEGAEERTIELPLPGRTMTFNGRDYLTQFALPNFLFHVVTAYGLLRKEGVPLGKVDFLAGAQSAA